MIVWPILVQNSTNNTFGKCNPSESLRNVALEWIQGIPYFELLERMLNSDVRIMAGSQGRHPKIESVIDICENGLAYDGALTLSAVTEIIQLVRPEGAEKVVIKLLELQKRLKYGLPTPISIALYELGFTDRVVSMELGSFLDNTSLDKRTIIQTIRQGEQNIRNILGKYPSYFVEKLNVLLRR